MDVDVDGASRVEMQHDDGLKGGSQRRCKLHNTPASHVSRAPELAESVTALVSCSSLAGAGSFERSRDVDLDVDDSSIVSCCEPACEGS